MELVVPPRLDERTIASVQELAVAAFVASDCEGMARVDFFVRENGEVVVNELNTIPGFTATSVYAKLFEASGISVRASCSTAWSSSRSSAATVAPASSTDAGPVGSPSAREVHLSAPKMSALASSSPSRR